MSDATAASTTAPFAASELVYFHPAAFSREKALLDAVGLVHTEKKYDASELGGTILAAALLDAERRGLVVLEEAKAPRLFGLRKVDTLFVKAGPSREAAPPGSFEARLAQVVATRSAPVEATDVFVEAWEEDAPDPWSWAVALVERGLSQRSLLEAREERRLKVFRTRVHHLPELTAALARSTDARGVKELLDRAQRERPDVWRHLQAALRKAATRRTERDTDSGPD